MDGEVRVVRPRYLEFPRGNYWAAPHRAYARLARERAAERPDVVHAHFAYPAGVAGAVAARAWGIPSVLTLHGSDVNVFPRVNALTAGRFRKAVREAGAVIAVSRALADRTQALTGRRPRVMPIGIDLRPFENLPGRAAARSKLGLPRDVPLVLFVGRLTVEKGVRELLGALASLRARGVFGLFVGGGPLQGEIRQSGVAESVGLQPSHVVPLYMAAADLLMLPSYSEGLPTVLIEAGAARLSVAATPVGGIPDLLAADRGVLLPARSASGAASAIASILDDPVAARSRAARLESLVREEHDIDRNARSLLGLYEELIAGERVRRPAPAGAA